MLALVVGEVHLIGAREAAAERWIGVAAAEGVHAIGVKGEVVEVRCLSRAVGEQGEKTQEVREERSKMVPKVFWEVMGGEEYLTEELHGLGRETGVEIYLKHVAEEVEQGLVMESWEGVQ